MTRDGPLEDLARRPAITEIAVPRPHREGDEAGEVVADGRGLLRFHRAADGDGQGDVRRGGIEGEPRRQAPDQEGRIADGGESLRSPISRSGPDGGTRRARSKP